MTDLSFPDRLPHELEPVGAVQVTACTWTREDNGNHTTSCGETWPVFISLPKPDEVCPWCGAARRMPEGTP